MALSRIAVLAEELEQARRIQLSLLPKTPPATTFLEIAAHMQTATEVAPVRAMRSTSWASS